MRKSLILIMLASALLVSCVSSGKYDRMVSWKDSLQTSSDSLQSIVIKNNETISSLYQQISEINKQKEKLQEEYSSLNQNYQSLKSSSSKEAQQYIEQLEALRDDITLREKKIQEIQQKLNARDSIVSALRNKINDALLGFKDLGLTVTVKEGKVYVSLSNQLLFKTGSTSIDKNGQDALLGLAQVLNTQPDINILVEGHTDDQRVTSQARFKDNWDLSVLRATEVVRYLTVEGQVEPTRIIASGRSEYFPVIAGESVDARAANRRTEIILTPKLEELFQIIGN
ncbi:MAG: OmpA family protein [Ignavibacteria bacterium]|nr:OmpA family protein [Ignavibacteria bacterium]